MKISLAAAMSFIMLLGTTTFAAADGSIIGSMPSNVTTDGKFIAQPGLELAASTPNFASYLWIGVPKGQSTVEVDIFNGNEGGLWNNHTTGNPVKTTFSLYADPMKTGVPSGLGSPLVFKTSDDFANANNAWATMYNGPVSTSAQAPSGYYFYLLWVQWDNPSISQLEFHAYKVQASGQISIVKNQQVAFDGGPNNVSTGPNYVGPVDPPLGSAGNTYNGQWDWYVYVPPGNNTITFNDCDADSVLDPTKPGTPPDDNPDQRFRISPDIQYTVFSPNGQALYFNPVPSGNEECDAHTFSITQSGLYHWQWNGVDAHNFVVEYVQYEMFAAPVTPFPVGASPSPTSTATPTTPATNTPVPSRGNSSPPPPQATSTPQATWTPTVMSSVTPRPASPTATRTPIKVPKLPATGDAGLPIFPILACAGLLILVGFSVRKRS